MCVCQSWGKLLLKVMRYNIVLLPKKITNYVTLRNVTNWTSAQLKHIK